MNIDGVEVTSDIEDNVEVGFLPPPPFENCASKFESWPKLSKSLP